MKSEKLSTEIAALQRKQKETKNAVAKKALTAKIDRLKKELDEITTSAQAKTALAKAQSKIREMSQKDFGEFIKKLSAKSEYSFLKGMSKSKIKDDIMRVAKPVGWRFRGRDNAKKPTKRDIKEGNNVYYEGRVNRSDVSRTVRLGQGGGVSYNDAIADFNGELMEHPIVLELAKHYNKTPQEVVKHLQPRLSTKGNRSGNTTQVYIDFTDTNTNKSVRFSKKYEKGGGVGDKPLSYYKYETKKVRIAWMGKIQPQAFYSAEEAMKEIEKQSQGIKSEIEKYSIKTPDKTIHLGKEYAIRYAEGGNLKPIPAGNKGLPNLPKEVRNRMGYMAEGGGVENEQLYYVVGKKNKQLVDISTDSRGEITPFTKEDANVFAKSMESNYDFNSIDIIPYRGKNARVKMATGGGVGEAKGILQNLKNKGEISLSVGGHGMIFMQINNGRDYKKSYNSYEEALDYYNKVNKYAKGGGVGRVKTYKLRAEGLNDFLAFLQTGMYMKIKSFTVEPIGVPDVVVTFETESSLSEIKSKLREIPDSHVMLQTVMPINEYTGERNEQYADGGGVGENSHLKGERAYITDKQIEDEGTKYIINITSGKNKGERVEREVTKYYVPNHPIKEWTTYFNSRKEAESYAEKIGLLIEYSNGGGLGEMHRSEESGMMARGGMAFSESALKEGLGDVLTHLYKAQNELDGVMSYLDRTGQGGLKSALKKKFHLESLDTTTEKLDNYLEK
jgi:hypothetical protein